MAARFATFRDWMANGAIIPAGDDAVVIPENYAEGQGVFRYKRGTGRLNFRQLPFEPTQSFFVITGSGPSGDVSGPATSTVGNFAIWTDATGTTLGDGPAPADFATAAQGALADTAVQPGDPLTDLSSGPATSGQVPESDGAGGISWVTPAGGGGDVVGPGSSTDNAVARFNGATGLLLQDSSVLIDDLGNITGALTINSNSFPAAPGTLATTATDLDVFSSGAATAGQVPEADGAGGVTWSTPAGGGDVVGPGTSTVGFIPTWADTTGTLLDTGLETSTGGNESADSGKVPVFGLEGQLAASATNSVTAAFRATTSGTATAIEVSNAGSGQGISIASATGVALTASTGNNTAGDLDSTSTVAPTLEVTNNDATNVGPLAHFHNDVGDGLEMANDGTLDWTTATGAQGTVDNLPVFGALTKGVVPAAGAVPSATKFLDETGAWSVPPDTGITQLTGDVTAGPGSGSQAATLASTAVTPGSYTYTSLTVDAKGRLTAASSGTTPLLPANDLSDVSSTSTARTNLVVVRQQLDQVGSGQTTTSSTLADITGLSLVVDASAHVSGVLRVLFEVSSTSGGIGLGINGSAAATYFAGRFETAQSAGNYVQQLTAFNATTAAGSVPAANTVYYAEVNFGLVNGGSSNTIVGQVSRGGSAGTLTIRAASLLITG